VRNTLDIRTGNLLIAHGTHDEIMKCSYKPVAHARGSDKLTTDTPARIKVTPFFIIYKGSQKILYASPRKNLPHPGARTATRMCAQT